MKRAVLHLRVNRPKICTVINEIGLCRDGGGVWGRERFSISQAESRGLCDYHVCTVRQLVSANVGTKSKQSFHQSSLETLNKGYFAEHQRCFRGLNICVLVNK